MSLRLQMTFLFRLHIFHGGQLELCFSRSILRAFLPIWATLVQFVISGPFLGISVYLGNFDIWDNGTFLGHLDPECPKCEWECKSPTSSHPALQIGRKRERLSGACAGALANWGHCHPVNVNRDVNLNENEKGFPRVTLNVIESGTSSIEETLNARPSSSSSRRWSPCIH